MMKIEAFELGPIGTYAYLITNNETQEAVLIDTPPGAAELFRPLLKERNYKLVGLFFTHGHWDHTADGQLIRALGVPTYAHAGDKELYADPASMLAFIPTKYDLQPVTIDHFVEEGQVFNMLGTAIRVHHVPGHSQGSILVYIEALEAAFAGDVIFRQSIGRTDFPQSDLNVLKNAIQQRIYTLPENTILYPGHGPTTTVGYEKKHNRYVKG